MFAPMAEAQDPVQKLGRGVANMLTGWVELPKNIYDTSVEENVIIGLTLGTVRGFGMFVVRTGAGIYEIATFPFAIPEDYAPVLIPEYVFSTTETVEVTEVAEIKTVELIPDNDYKTDYAGRVGTPSK